VAVELHAVWSRFVELSHLLDSELRTARLYYDWRIGLRLEMAKIFDNFSTVSGTSLAWLQVKPSTPKHDMNGGVLVS